jgi:7-cyano-7-deazaguanine synthase in queuosine biosynthesis
MTVPLNILRVAVLEEGQRAPSGWKPCWIGENVSFTTAQLESFCLAAWKPLAFDALLVAAAIEYCDRDLKRPALGWCREIEVRIPVHDPTLWASKAVNETVHDALNFLTGDRWHIKFVGRKRPEAPPQQIQFDIPRGQVSIIPFSDGMDSRAVAGIEGRKLGDRLIRVRLGDKVIDRPSPTDVKQPFTAVPYRVKREQRSRESSVRSRGFKFAIVSGVAACLVNAEDIIVPESGQGALGPALVPVGHAYEDYRNHPLYMAKVAAFLTALFKRPVRFQFPRLWFTKGQTLATYAKHADIGVCLEARSCWQQSGQVSVDGHRRQCGICAACMLRRIAGFTEKAGTYVWENLSAPTFEGGAARGFDKITAALREYAIAAVLHMDHLAALSFTTPHALALKRHAFQLSRVLCLSQRETESALAQLLTQHRQEWQNFLGSLGTNSFVVKWTSSANDLAA